MKTITFYSYKGGVGRSLTLSNIAMRLADLGKKVCLIDFDLEAPGLHHKFQEYLPESKNPENTSDGVVEFIYNFQSNGIIEDSLNNYIINLGYMATLNGSICLIPAGNMSNGDYWKKLSSINWKDLFYSEANDGIKLLLHLKELIIRDVNPDYILIDSRTGITDISGIAMTLLADEVVVFAANNSENINGTARIVKSLKDPSNNLVGTLPKIHFVLSRIPFYSNSSDIHKENTIVNNALFKINKDGELVDKVFVIHSDRELEEKESFKINMKINSLQSSANAVPIQEDYLNLFKEITVNDLTTHELETFERIKQSQELIEEAQLTNDSAVKLIKLQKAVDLNPSSPEALNQLANVYSSLENYESALQIIDKALYLLPKSIGLLHNKGYILGAMDRFKETELLMDEIIQQYSHYSPAFTLKGIAVYRLGRIKYALEMFLNALNLSQTPENYNLVGNAYRRLGKFDEAFLNIYKCLELDPDYPTGNISLAEIYAEIGNDNEFFRNLQFAFLFGMTSEDFQDIINSEPVYERFFDDVKFKKLLKSYRIKVNLEKKSSVN